MMEKGKSPQVTVTAVSRELAGERHISYAQ